MTHDGSARWAPRSRVEMFSGVSRRSLLRVGRELALSQHHNDALPWEELLSCPKGLLRGLRMNGQRRHPIREIDNKVVEQAQKRIPYTLL